jgi:hypothetical protein
MFVLHEQICYAERSRFLVFPPLDGRDEYNSSSPAHPELFPLRPQKGLLRKSGILADQLAESMGTKIIAVTPAPHIALQPAFKNGECGLVVLLSQAVGKTKGDDLHGPRAPLKQLFANGKDIVLGLVPQVLKEPS